MNESLRLLLVLMAGVVLGAVFFGGLWWTVQKNLATQQPAVWFLGSHFLRTAIVLAGFFFIGRGHWERMLVCLLGFLMARLIVTTLARIRSSRSRPAQTTLPRGAVRPTNWTKTSNHAP
ncbi:MAG: ATP synthase subunit I [Bryobacteraceae bacterium]